MSWQAATAVMLQERLGLEKYVTAQMYYSLVGRGLEYEFLSFAESHNIGILVWSALAGEFLSGKYGRNNPAPDGTRYAEAGQFVPFDKENGYKIVDVLKEVAKRHDASAARVALAWVLGRPAVTSVIVAARKPEQKTTSAPLSCGYRVRMCGCSMRSRTQVFRTPSGWSFNSTPRKTRVQKCYTPKSMEKTDVGRTFAAVGGPAED
jgi:aldo/keto reductase family protein